MLTPSAVANAKPREKAYKMADGGSVLAGQSERPALVALEVPAAGLGEGELAVARRVP